MASAKVLRENVYDLGTGQIIMSEVVNDGTAAHRLRMYAITDAQGNVTAIIDDEELAGQSAPKWQVVERYSYTPYGQLEVLDQNWVPTAQPTTSTRGWEFFHQDMRFSVTTGLYISSQGAYDPFLGREQRPATSVWIIQPPSYTNATGDAWTGDQLDASWSSNFVSALWDPENFGSAGQVSLNGKFWGTLGVVRGVTTAAFTIAAGILVPPLGYAMLAAGIGYGIYDYESRANGESSDGLSPGVGTFADLTGLSSINRGLNDPNLDSYDSGQLVGGGLAQAGATVVGGAMLLNSAPSLFGYQWALGGVEADGSLTLGAGRFLRPIPTGEGIVFPEWQVGDPIDKITPEGEYPSWETIRSRYWMSRASLAQDGEFSPQNMGLMRAGYAPVVRFLGQDLDSGELFEGLEEMELHHSLGNRGVPGYDTPLNLRELWPWEHATIDPQRAQFMNYQFVKIISQRG